MAVAQYYRDLTKHYLLYGGDEGFHYGLDGEDDRSHLRGLVRSHERLVEGLDLGPRSRVLDVGCGIGSFAAYCAQRFGCAVTGVTVCPEHVDLALQLARCRGVAHLVRIELNDMNDLNLEAESFDLVTNQESLCYALDKEAYLRNVRRLLTPGGHWSAIAFSLPDSPLDARARALYRTVQKGFHLPHLEPPHRIRGFLEAQGFDSIEVEDLTRRTLRTARHIVRHCHIPMTLERLHLDWLFFGFGDKRANHCGHFRAGHAYSRGLLEGRFAHIYYRARRPARDQSTIPGPP